MADPLLSATASFAIGCAILFSTLAGVAICSLCTPLSHDDMAAAVNILMNFAFHFFYLGGLMIDKRLTMLSLLVIWAVLVFLLEIPAWRNLSFEKIPRSVTTTDIFENIEVTTLQAVVVGAGQMILLIYYIWGIYEAEPLAFTTSRELGFYWSGVLALSSYAIGKKHDLGSQGTKPAQLVWFICASRHGMACSHHDMEGEERVIELKERRCSLVLRYVLSILVNGYGSASLRCFVPLQVASSPDAIQFVLSAVAAVVVLEIDNQPNKEFTFVKQQRVGQISLPLTPGAVRWKSKWSGAERSLESFVEEEAVSLVMEVERSANSDELQTRCIRIVDQNSQEGDQTEPSSKTGDVENLGMFSSAKSLTKIMAIS